MNQNQKSRMSPILVKQDFEADVCTMNSFIIVVGCLQCWRKHSSHFSLNCFILYVRFKAWKQLE